MSLRPLFLVLLLTPLLRADEAYTKSIQQWRADRVARLTTPDGWLTLIGRHQLALGDNSAGTAEDNSIKLAAGPPYLATVTLSADKHVTLLPAPASRLEVDGVPTQDKVELLYQGDKPTRVTFGTASFYVMQRGLSQEEAVQLLVNGFVKDVLQELPMEFAVEAQKLVAISLEGSVG